ncbi:MAG: histidine--tRNA ligase [bacterium]|nr:histidine--tRNA ligase [bacterium]
MADKNVQKVTEGGGTEPRRVEPMLPGGFRDYGPREAISRAQMLSTISNTFELFGFDPMETSSVQRKDVLFGGEEESEKIVFEVKGSRDSESDTALRFDLTVPFARFMAANPEIPKPFKRYQIGNVWRGESPQAGRYREFMQADIDIIGSNSANADAEVIATIYKTFTNLGINDFVIKINSRKILNSLPSYADFPKEKLWDVLRIIDKKDKIGDDVMREELTKEIGEAATERIKSFLNGNVAEDELSDLRSILETMGIDKEKIVIDYTIVRGLAYYTGMVLETFLTKAPEMGSIASGGRYDELVVPFTGQMLPAVGASIGVDRLFAALEKLGAIEKKVTKTQALVLNLSAELMSDCLEIVKQLRDAKVNTSFYVGDDMSFQAQLSYAVKKEIPFVVIYGETEKAKGIVAVKNLATREQTEVKKEHLADFFQK